MGEPAALRHNVPGGDIQVELQKNLIYGITLPEWQEIDYFLIKYRKFDPDAVGPPLDVTPLLRSGRAEEAARY